MSFLKKKGLHTYLFCIKTKVAIKFVKEHFFTAENRLGAEKVNGAYKTASVGDCTVIKA